MRFSDTIRDLRVENGTVALSWIGQAGFLLKTAGGKVLVIDPCLTDYVYECTHEHAGLGFKRLAPALFEPDEIPIDWFLSSHEHEDHMDMPMMPAVMQNPGVRVLCNRPSVELMKNAGLLDERTRLLQVGDRLDLGECVLTVTDCDHGPETPCALGFLLDFGFVKIYYSGDTALSPERLQVPMAAQPEVALLPINGEYGNLNSFEAAKYAAMLKSRVCIPHHFFTFANHGGDPRDAIRAFPEFAPDCRLELLTPGEIRVFGSDV